MGLQVPMFLWEQCKCTLYTLHTVCTSIDLWARAMNINISLIQNVPPPPLTKKHCSFRERHRSMMSSPLYREFLAISNSVSTGRHYLRVPTRKHQIFTAEWFNRYSRSLSYKYLFTL